LRYVSYVGARKVGITPLYWHICKLTHLESCAYGDTSHPIRMKLNELFTGIGGEGGITK